MPYVYPFLNADEKLKRAVWAKGRLVPGQDINVLRQDRCLAQMKYIAHGDRNDPLGWEIDHILPQAKGGGDELENLQPLNWQNNAAKSDTYPWDCGE